MGCDERTRKTEQWKAFLLNPWCRFEVQGNEFRVLDETIKHQHYPCYFLSLMTTDVCGLAFLHSQIFGYLGIRGNGCNQEAQEEEK